MGSREELDRCKVAINCAASVHLSNCPWHHENVEALTVTDADWDKFHEMLDAPPKDIKGLAALVHGLTQEQYDEAKLTAAMTPLQMNTRLAALYMKYPSDVWCRIVDTVRELARRRQEQER